MQPSNQRHHATMPNRMTKATIGPETGIMAAITTKPKPSAGNPPATTTPTAIPATVLDPFVGSRHHHRRSPATRTPRHRPRPKPRLPGHRRQSGWPASPCRWASGYDRPPPLAAAPEGSTEAQAEAAGDAPGGDAGQPRRLRPGDAVHDGGM